MYIGEQLIWCRIGRGIGDLKAAFNFLENGVIDLGDPLLCQRCRTRILEEAGQWVADRAFRVELRLIAVGSASPSK